MSNNLGALSNFTGTAKKSDLGRFREPQLLRGAVVKTFSQNVKRSRTIHKYDVYYMNNDSVNINH
jgi:hypothetical protein